MYTLVPTCMAVLLLYWWILINTLLEDIHEDKKAEARINGSSGLGSETNFQTSMRRSRRDVTLV